MLVYPDDLRGLASLMLQRGQQLDAIGDDLVRCSDWAAWRGPAADQYWTRMRERRAELARQSTRLVELAQRLRRTATEYEGRILDCRRIEQNVRAWFAAHAPGPGQVPIWQGWHWTPYSRLPAPQSAEWLSVHDYFRMKGVVL
jgi:hypothetical protein